MAPMSEHFPIRWDIAEENLDEAAFLWSQWEASLVAADYTLDEVARGPEGRLLAHIDALVVGGEPVARRLLRPGLWSEDEEDVFASAFALLMSEEPARLDAVLEVLPQGEPHQCAAIQRALMLAPPGEELGSHLKALLPGASPAVQAVSLSVLTVHRIDPGLPLDAFTTSGQPELELAALRAARLFPHRLAPRVIQRTLGSSTASWRRTH